MDIFSILVLALIIVVAMLMLTDRHDHESRMIHISVEPQEQYRDNGCLPSIVGISILIVMAVVVLSGA